jgi:hypothetical protein
VRVLRDERSDSFPVAVDAIHFSDFQGAGLLGLDEIRMILHKMLVHGRLQMSLQITVEVSQHNILCTAWYKVVIVSGQRALVSRLEWRIKKHTRLQSLEQLRNACSLLLQVFAFAHTS